jgi:sulfide dehydrogenase cytochrome subunit
MTPIYSASRAIFRQGSALRRALIWSLLVALAGSGVATWVIQALAQTATPKYTATLSANTGPVAGNGMVPASTMAHSCAACHGTHGQLGDEYFMPLAGIPVRQFVSTMADFRDGRRPSTLMGHVARGFSDAELQAMGEFFASQTLPPIGTASKGAAR